MALDEISDWQREKFQEEAPDLLPLAESFLDKSNRWYIQGVVTRPGWYGEEAGFFIDLTVELPGAEGLDAVIWVGKDHALLDLRSSQHTEGCYRMTHETLREMLGALPRPWMDYEMEEVGYAR